MEIIEPLPKLPPNWKYVRILQNKKIVYFNTDTVVFSQDMP
jgi:hypothetical protein